MTEDLRVSATVHTAMTMFIQSRTFTSFIFLVIIINTALLVAQTYESIAVRAGKFSAWYTGINHYVYLFFVLCTHLTTLFSR